MSGAEEALAALARDLVEEIAAGRALELAQVQGYERFEGGREEHVRGYASTPKPGSWIPQPDWLRGQQTWKRNEWQPHPGGDVDIPPPKTGAAAVHPQLGGHLLTQPGDTVSGHAHAHVPQPFPVKPPDARDNVIAEMHQTLAIHRQAEVQRLSAEQAAAEAQRTGIPVPGTYAPLTDEQFTLHTANVEHALDEAVRAGHATDQEHTLDGKGLVWEPDRAAAHAAIIRDYLDKQATVPGQRVALFMGGLPGAGKSTLLKHHPDISLNDYAVVNSDDFKEELARRGMVPEVEGLSPLESSHLIHYESVHLANLAFTELTRRGKNVALDTSMTAERATRSWIKSLKGSGYHITTVFIDVPVEKSAERVTRRYRKQLEQYRQGANPLGGRYVPEDIIMAGEAEPGVSRARVTFDALRDAFGRWELWDGSKARPSLTEKSGAPRSSGIASVEELQKAAAARAAALRAGNAKGYTGNTEQEARAAEKGTMPGGLAGQRY